MQVTETLSDGLKRAYTVRLPAADIEGERAKKLAEVGRSLRLPGFRPGKVPASVVRKRYGTAVMAEVLQTAVNAATDRLVSDRGLRPAGQPQVGLIGEPAPDPATPADLEFKVELELLPDIATPDLAGLTLERLHATPTDEAVAAALARLAEGRPAYDDITEARGAETGDTLVVDFAGRTEAGPFAGGEGKEASVEIGGEGFIPGFAEQLTGMRPGEGRTIEVTFPDPYHAAELAGQAATFEVTATALKRKRLPAIDDDFAKAGGFDDLAALRQAAVGSLQQEYDRMARLKLKRELLDALAARADFPAPENLTGAEFQAIWQRVEAEMKAGQVDEEDRGKSEETLRAEYRAIAERRVKLGLLLSEIGRTAGIQVTPQELSQALSREAMRYPGQEQQVVEFFRKTPQAVEQLRGPIFEDKVVDYVLELASVTDREATPEELELPPAGAGFSVPSEAAADEAAPGQLTEATTG